MRILWFMKKQLDVALDRTVRLAMLDALGRAGHDVTLVTGFRSQRPDFGYGERIRYIGSSSAPLINHQAFIAAFKRALPRLVGEIRPDAVILDPWTTEAAQPWRATARGVDGPVVVTDVRTLPVGRRGILDGLIARSFRRGIAATGSFDGVTSITPMMLTELREEYSLDPALPSAVWGSGVDLVRFDPALGAGEAREKTRDGLGLGDAFAVIYHGAISRDRGVGDLIAAVADAGVLDDGRRVELLLVGDGADRVSLLEDAARRGVADRVHYVPPVPNERIPPLIAAADAGCLPFPDLPGWRVSSPIKLFEYLAMRRPVVLTDIPANRLGADGLAAARFTPDNDPASLAEGIRAVAAIPPATLAEATAEARRFVADEYSWDAQARRLLAFLDMLVEGRDDARLQGAV